MKKITIIRQGKNKSIYATQADFDSLNKDVQTRLIETKAEKAAMKNISMSNLVIQ